MMFCIEHFPKAKVWIMSEIEDQDVAPYIITKWWDNEYYETGFDVHIPIDDDCKDEAMCFLMGRKRILEYINKPMRKEYRVSFIKDHFDVAGPIPSHWCRDPGIYNNPCIQDNGIWTVDVTIQHTGSEEKDFCKALFFAKKLVEEKKQKLETDQMRKEAL